MSIAWFFKATLKYLCKGIPSTKQAERLKSRERRTKVDRLDGQWARWSIGSLDRIGLMVDRLNGQ